MTYRIIQWATSTIGRNTIAGILGHPDLELVGARVYSEEKDGVDVGEIAGVGPLGIVATRDVDALLAMDADCVCFTCGRMSWLRTPMETLEEIELILRSGKNVVNLWWPSLVYPQAMGDGIHERLESACKEGGSSFCTLGMEPGYGSTGLALTALALTREVQRVHMYQFMNNSVWEGPAVTEFFGFGAQSTDTSPALQPGHSSKYHATTVQLIADAIGLTIDELVEEHSVIRAEEGFDILAGRIEKDTISGIRYRVQGMVAGEPRVVVEHVERLRDEDFPELEFVGNGYRAEIEGLPNIRLDLKISAPPWFEGDIIEIPSAMNVVNAIPRVCQAPPGVLSMLDLAPFPSRNVHHSLAR